MTIEEELKSLREENKVLREQLVQRDEIIEQQQERVAEQNALLQQLQEQLSRLSEQNAQVEQMREQITGLSEQVKSLRNQISKDSHNSHLPPSSDRFARKPKSLRKKSEKPSGGQPGHQGSSLQFSCTPEESVARSWICHRLVWWYGNIGPSRNSVPTASRSAVLHFQPGCKLPSNMDPTLERRRCIW